MKIRQVKRISLEFDAEARPLRQERQKCAGGSSRRRAGEVAEEESGDGEQKGRRMHSESGDGGAQLRGRRRH